MMSNKSDKQKMIDFRNADLVLEDHRHRLSLLLLASKKR